MYMSLMEGIRAATLGSWVQGNKASNGLHDVSDVLPGCHCQPNTDTLGKGTGTHWISRESLGHGDTCEELLLVVRVERTQPAVCVCVCVCQEAGSLFSFSEEWYGKTEKEQTVLKKSPQERWTSSFPLRVSRTCILVFLPMKTILWDELLKVCEMYWYFSDISVYILLPVPFLLNKIHFYVAFQSETDQRDSSLDTYEAFSPHYHPQYLISSLH